MPITVRVVSREPAARAAEVVIRVLYAGQKKLPAFTAALKDIGFKGQWGSGEVVLSSVRGGSTLWAVVGLGDRSSSEAQQAEGLRRGLGKVIGELRRHVVRSAVLDLTGEAALPLPAGRPANPAGRQATLAAAAVEAAELASYRYTAYRPKLRQEQRQRRLQTLFIVVDSFEEQATKAAVKAAQRVLPGVELARRLVDAPASAVRPVTLVEQAREIVKRSPALSLTVLDRAAAEKAGWRAFLAVAQGSDTEPYVIHLTYLPDRQADQPSTPRKKIFIVGKGITFDSGGLSLKPAQYMEDMKIDMAGAAAVLGLFLVLPALKLDVEVHGVIAACENMPSGSAFRPGDVVTAYNGKTIEILNTDAEGRVTLADALSYAAEQKPDAIVDLATLTGAVMVALGETVAGLWSTDETLKQQLLMAAARSGEGLEDLPMTPEYHHFVESKVADVRNTTTTPFAGGTMGALFLREFVGKIPWAHLDIAGPVYLKRRLLPYYVEGATGYGVRTLVEFLKAI